MSGRGFSRESYGTAQASRWDTVVAAINVCDSMFDLLQETRPAGEAYVATELAAKARAAMWRTQAPDFTALAWKLEQAIYFNDHEGEPDNPLNLVLNDLRALLNGGLN